MNLTGTRRAQPPRTALAALPLIRLSAAGFSVWTVIHRGEQSAPSAENARKELQAPPPQLQALQGRFCSGPHWPSPPVCWAGKAPGTARTPADTKMNNLSFLPRQTDNIARNTEVPQITRQQGARMAFL